MGAEFLVNTQTEGDQSAPEICALAGGNFVAVWNDDRTDLGGGDDIRAQRFDVDGNRIGGEIVASAPTSLQRDVSFVTALGGGGFVVGWNDHGSGAGRPDQRMQIFDASGAKIGGRILVDADLADWAFDGKAAGLPGGFVVTWNVINDDAANPYDVHGQIFDSAGAKAGPAFPMNMAIAGGQLHTAVVTLSDGNFIVAWTDTGATGLDTSLYAVKAQLFDSAGARLGTEILVNTTTEGYQSHPQLTALPGEGFVVTWLQQGSGGQPGDAIAQIFRFDNTGPNGDGGDNIVLGTTGDDTLAGNGGNDTLYGASGNDRIEGGTGDDVAWGGDGKDRLYSGSGIDALHGEAEADKFFLGATLTADDLVAGGGGNDTLVLSGDYANLVFGADRR